MVGGLIRVKSWLGTIRVMTAKRGVTGEAGVSAVTVLPGILSLISISAVVVREYSLFFLLREYRAKEESDDNRGRNCDQARQHETVVEQILSNLRCSGPVKRDRCQQRPIRGEKENAVSCRVECD